jgi:hypothetical protein
MSSEIGALTAAGALTGTELIHIVQSGNSRKSDLDAIALYIGDTGTVWYTGSGAPGAGTGNNGDFYLRQSNGAIYQKSGGSWAVIISSIYATANDGFKTIVVSGQSDVVADSSTDTLTLVAGTNITITTNAGSDTITIAASGGSVSDSFKTIAVSGQSDVIADSSTDTLTLVAGSNITITTNAGTDTITIAATGGGSGNSFETIVVSGQSNVVADSSTDTLTLVAGSNITITTNAGTDTITIAASGGGGNSFETIAVSGQSNVVADSSTDTLTLAAGAGIAITTNAGTDTITIASTLTQSNLTMGKVQARAQGIGVW